MVTSIPQESENGWELLKQKCLTELKTHFEDLANGKDFTGLEFKVEYGNKFETSGSFTLMVSHHIKSSVSLSKLSHIESMEPCDIRLFQKALNAVL